MAKPNRMTEPVAVSKSELIKLGAANVEVKKYVDGLLPLLSDNAESVAGMIEVRNENGLPVLRFTPRRVPLADLMKNKI